MADNRQNRGNCRGSAVREYGYGANSQIGTFPDALLQEANKRVWVVISMKDNWKRIFSW